MRGIDKDAVKKTYNVKIAQKFQRVGDEEAVELYRYISNGVYRYKIKPKEMSTKCERVGDKDTVENRYNVSFAQGVGKDAVRHSHNQNGGDQRKRCMKEIIHKGIQSNRIFDKDTVENRYKVIIPYDFSRKIVKNYRMSKIGVNTCKLSYKVELYGD